MDLLSTTIAAEADGVEARFRILKWREGEWDRYRRAEAAERQALRTGEVLPDEDRRILDQYRLDPAVLQAEARLQMNLDGIRAVFDQYWE